jgi:hypothetical protein
MKKGTIFATVVGAALLAAAPFSLQWSQKSVALSLDSADARIGRPLTPMSVAGVHRRAYRHGAYGTSGTRRSSNLFVLVLCLDNAIHQLS